ncbi:MAG: hypothetical protein IJV91_04505 [Kiritimatiellae bacterium]|nr:hypothetical protein [Kiritimatiellia bacterium]
MSLHVKDDFAPGTPISAVGCDWFNKVGGFVNALIGGLGLKVSKPSRPSVSAPVSIEIEVEQVKKMLDAESPSGEPMNLAKSVGYEAADEETQKLDKEWSRGDVELDEDGEPVKNEDGTTLPVGATFQVISRVVSVGGVAYRLHIREMAVGADGRIKSISKEKGFFEIVSL